MSKQSEAKLKQNYNPKPVPRVCMNCEHYLSDMVKVTGQYSVNYYIEEKNKRCGLGEFAVKKTATCNEWRPK